MDTMKLLSLAHSSVNGHCPEYVDSRKPAASASLTIRAPTTDGCLMGVEIYFQPWMVFGQSIRTPYSQLDAESMGGFASRWFPAKQNNGVLVRYRAWSKGSGWYGGGRLISNLDSKDNFKESRFFLFRRNGASYFASFSLSTCRGIISVVYLAAVVDQYCSGPLRDETDWLLNWLKVISAPARGRLWVPLEGQKIAFAS